MEAWKYDLFPKNRFLTNNQGQESKRKWNVLGTPETSVLLGGANKDSHSLVGIIIFKSQ